MYLPVFVRDTSGFRALRRVCSDPEVSLWRLIGAESSRGSMLWTEDKEEKGTA